MNEAEKEDSAKFNIELCAGTDLVIDEQRRFNRGYLFLQDIYRALSVIAEESDYIQSRLIKNSTAIQKCNTKSQGDRFVDSEN